MADNLPMSQKDRILKHFRDGKTLTQAQARSHNIEKLSARINELRRSGLQIDSKPYVNRLGRKVVRYEMI